MLLTQDPPFESELLSSRMVSTLWPNGSSVRTPLGFADEAADQDEEWKPAPRSAERASPSVSLAREEISSKEAWEVESIQRLTELLTKPQLQSLSGKLDNVIRQTRRIQTGIDRAANKQELAAAILIQRGKDLFHDKSIRQAVKTACGISTAPKAWRAGKKAAIAFVRAAKFPMELAGAPPLRKRRDSEYFPPRFELGGLADYQIEIQRKIRSVLHIAGSRAMAVLPTGAGKTRVAVESLRDWLTARHENQLQGEGGTGIWLAHTDELCEQAFVCFKQVWQSARHACPLHLIRLWGSYTRKLGSPPFDEHHFHQHPSILISTPQRMANLLQSQDRATASAIAGIKRAVGALVIDEAHRAATPSYRAIFDALQASEFPVSVIGLTATPFRMEYLGEDSEKGTRELKEMFTDLIEPSKLGPNPRLTLQQRGVLAIPVPIDVDTSFKISIPRDYSISEQTEESNEQFDRFIAETADDPRRRCKILEAILPLAADDANSLLYFGPSVSDAECMAYFVRSNGLTAGVVSGETRPSERRRIIEEFKQGKIRVLCSCEVLTTGFDAPRVTHVVMGRPTISRVLYEQMIGRGLRGPQFGGTEKCVILNCVDTYPKGGPTLAYEWYRRMWNDDASSQMSQPAREKARRRRSRLSVRRR